MTVRWYYISFVEAQSEGDVFAGACVVKAVDERDALAESKIQGCNPGGEAMVVEVEAEYGDPPVDAQNVLIRDKAELHERFTPWLGAQRARPETLREREERGGQVGAAFVCEACNAGVPHGHN